MSKASAKTRKEVRDTKPLGAAWGQELQAFVTQEAGEMAKRLVGKDDGREFVEVHVPVTLHLKYARKGGELHPPTVQCACVLTTFGDGGSVCVCKGADADSCDCLIIV